ncbi:uncharacterized protein LOC109433094 [Aedes albopictus]|uniref:CCHC-type domain-containing protein n=1 Tax=Aedes albopictus TaxID=7160 RepID=A0ABM1ZV50_AEDAL
METYRIYAKDLEDDEVEYELSIRGYPVEGPMETRYRSLRLALRQPEDGNAVLNTEYSLTGDFTVVPIKLKEIETLLETDDLKCFSRLVHYHKRVRRYVPETDAQRRNQQELLDVINRMVRKYYNIDLRAAADEVPVMRLSANRPEVTGATARGVHSARPSSTGANVTEEDFGKAETSFQPEEVELISFSDERRPLACPQGTPKTAAVSRPSSGTIPKQPMMGVVGTGDGPGRIVEEIREPIPRVKRSESGIVPSGHASPKGGVGGVPANRFESRHPLRPIEVDCLWETPEFKSSVPNTLIQPKQRVSSEPFAEPRRIVSPGVVRGRPAEEKIDMSDFVHKSEIQGYIKSYLDQVFMSERRGLGGMNPPVVDTLVDRIANIGIHDPEVSQISRAANQRPEVDFDPPLQLPRTIPIYGEPVRNNQQTNSGVRVDSHRIDPGLISPFNNGGMPAYSPTNMAGPHTNVGGGWMNNPLRRRLPHQTCNIIEKWPKFAGDSNPVPVVDFLRQIEILSRSYQVEQDELRMHAHLLFKDDAYVWFTAYESQLATWDMLLTYLRMRYDNPNRDRFIREEMRNRKQRPNELFSAYLTDLEAMSQRMTRKMTKDEKFDIVVENMKISYKRRLALQPVNSIEHLAQLCYRFDALEANLYAPRTAPKTAVNVIGYEEESDPASGEDEDACVLAVQTRNYKKGSANSSKPKAEKEDSQLLCWNCRKGGHMWRECNRKKGIFCHICGAPDTTAYRCPENHNLKPRDSSPEVSKNE